MSDNKATIGEQQRDIIVKAEILGGQQVVMSNKLDDDPFAGLYTTQGVLEPPYSAEVLTTIYEQSGILPQCVEAMETNVDGFGFTLEAEAGLKKDEQGKYPPEAEKERVAVQAFFEYANADESFTKIRKKLRRDYETVGYGFWEILRNTVGEIAGIEHLPAYTMRLCRTDRAIQTIDLLVKEPETFTYTKIPHARRFRRFVQIKDNITVYFKEFGDPRDLNADTGEWLTKAQAAEIQQTGKLSGKDARLATEVLYFSQYSPRSPYGVPRWMGALPAVLGERAADEVNLNYFDNKAIPPLAILVSGRLAGDSKQVIEQHIEKNIKGRNNFHSILVLEAETPPNPMAGGAQRATIELKPLTEAIQKDAMFMEYTKQTRNKARSAFRLPPLYVGESQDYTKATAAESREVAEEQVFGPERDDFDFTINRVLLPAMGVRFWKFKSLAPTQDNANQLTDIIDKLSKAGLTPREARVIMAEIFNKELPDPQDADWLDTPIQIYLGMLTAGMTQEQIAQAEANAQKALEAAKAQAKANPQQPPGQQQPGKEGQPKGIEKADGIQEFVNLLVEIRKGVLEHEEPEGVPISTF